MIVEGGFILQRLGSSPFNVEYDFFFSQKKFMAALAEEGLVDKRFFAEISENF